MCANRPAPAWPRSIGSDGMGLCAMLSQRRQENAGRTCLTTSKWPGM
jgi:hypothetical protein